MNSGKHLKAGQTTEVGVKTSKAPESTKPSSKHVLQHMKQPEAAEECIQKALTIVSEHSKGVFPLI